MTRLEGLIEEAQSILRRGIQKHVYGAGKKLAGIVVLYSGGKDSTVLAHLFRHIATAAAHANTGIGIERTREFVRATCGLWGLPLLERHPPRGSTYRELVLAHGFPGPGHHFKMYQRLKERALRQVRKELVPDPRKARVVFLAGRRRDESRRRMNVPATERVGSTVWISPLVNWNALDLGDYRDANPGMPINEVSNLIHMSGECLCGAFAKPNELAEIGTWFPDIEKEIHDLESEVRAAGFKEPKCRWGWGAEATNRRSKSGPLCSSCALR